MSLQQWFTIDDKHLVKWMWVKKLCRKTLAQNVFDESSWGKDTDPNVSAKSLTLLILCSGVSIVWLTTTQTRVSDATAVTFSVKCFNPLKLYLLSGNIFRKWFASYFLFIHEHLIIMWSPTANAVTTLLLTSGFHRCQQRIFKKNTNYFYAIRISI